MSVFSKADAARLQGYLEQEIELLGQIFRLTQEQTALLAADEIEDFDKSLDNRQQQIDKVDGLHQESKDLMQSYISYSSLAKGNKITSLDKLMAQVQELLSQCAQLNESNSVNASEKAKSYSRRIGELTNSRKGMESYIVNVENNSELFDKKM